MSNKEISVINGIELNGSLVSKRKQKSFSFRLAGAPPDIAFKLIHIEKNHFFFEIKETIKREYKLNPILDIQFLCKGYVLQNNLHLNLSQIPANTEILIMGVQLGA